MKKFVLAAVIAYVVLMGTNYLIHGVWLAPGRAMVIASYSRWADDVCSAALTTATATAARMPVATASASCRGCRRKIWRMAM